MVDQPPRAPKVSPVLAAIVAWLVPGAGYLLIGQRARGLTIGVSIFFLFFFGLMVGGVRCLDVPGYSPHGQQVFYYVQENSSGARVGKTAEKDKLPADAVDPAWILTRQPVDELRSKPWSIAQIMIGPLDLLCDKWAIAVSQPVDPNAADLMPIAPRSHARVNELGVLYTAVAGMLNLLAIIDSAHRAAQSEAA